MLISRDEVRAKLNTVFQDVFEDDLIEIFDEMTADDLEQWDSVSHISLVLAVEAEFNVKLSAAAVGRLNNVGAMVDLLSKAG